MITERGWVVSVFPFQGKMGGKKLLLVNVTKGKGFYKLITKSQEPVLFLNFSKGCC